MKSGSLRYRGQLTRCISRSFENVKTVQTTMARSKRSSWGTQTWFEDTGAGSAALLSVCSSKSLRKAQTGLSLSISQFADYFRIFTNFAEAVTRFDPIVRQ